MRNCLISGMREKYGNNCPALGAAFRGSFNAFFLEEDRLATNLHERIKCDGDRDNRDPARPTPLPSSGRKKFRPRLTGEKGNSDARRVASRRVETRGKRLGYIARGRFVISRV